MESDAWLSRIRYRENIIEGVYNSSKTQLNRWSHIPCVGLETDVSANDKPIRRGFTVYNMTRIPLSKLVVCSLPQAECMTALMESAARVNTECLMRLERKLISMKRRILRLRS